MIFFTHEPPLQARSSPIVKRGPRIVVSTTTVGKHTIVKINILRMELQSSNGFEEGPK